MKEFLRNVPHKSVTYIAAIDGRRLQESGGRWVDMGKNTVRASWDEGKTRITRTFALGKSFGRGLTNPWSVIGAILSHEVAVKRALSRLQAGAPAVCIMEDDCALGKPLADVDNVAGAIGKTYDAFTSNFASWELLLWGGEPNDLWAKASRNACQKHVEKPVVVDICVAEVVYEAHAYMLKSEAAANHVLASLARGATPDGALVRYMNHACTPKNYSAFFFQPNLIRQTGDDSSTCVGKNWKTALKETAPPKKRKYTKESRGAAPIKKRNLKQMRRQVGAKGGQASAGGGSSVQAVRRKVAAMRRFKTKHKRWPSCYEAKQMKVSYVLWKRISSE